MTVFDLLVQSEFCWFPSSSFFRNPFLVARKVIVEALFPQFTGFQPESQKFKVFEQLRSNKLVNLSGNWVDHSQEKDSCNQRLAQRIDALFCGKQTVGYFVWPTHSLGSEVRASNSSPLVSSLVKPNHAIPTERLTQMRSWIFKR